MKIIFFGTSEYVLPVLTKLHKAFVSGPGKSPIVAVVTQKPRPSGRKQILTYSPVDTWAHKHSIPIFFDPNDLTRETFQADIGILAAYGGIIPGSVIRLFPHGILNIHPSLLPKYRGASPIQSAIASGEKVTGATIIRLDEKLDHGPIISQFKEELAERETTETLRNRLFDRGADVLVTLIEPYLAGKIKPKTQDESQVIFTRQIRKEDGFIPPKYLEFALKGVALEDKWEIPFIKDCVLSPTPYTLDCFIRAMFPWPGSWTYVQLMTDGQKLTAKKRLKILKAHQDINHQSLIIDQVQLEGKDPVSWEEFKRGYPNAELAKD